MKLNVWGLQSLFPMPSLPLPRHAPALPPLSMLEEFEAGGTDEGLRTLTMIITVGLERRGMDKTEIQVVELTRFIC